MFNTVKMKILTLAGLPLLVAVVLSVIVIYSNYTVFREMKDVETLTQLGRKMSSLVHEMQKERGATGVFMGSKGSKFATELREQRSLTDEKRQEFEEALATFEAKDFPEFAAALDTATAHLAGLGELRTQASALSIPTGEGLGFYTQHNGLMLHAISAIAAASGDGQVRTQIYAYENYLLGKERAGIERAVMSNTFAADAFAEGTFARFSKLMNEQDTYFRVFRSLAPEEQINFFDEKLSGTIIDEVQHMRDIAVAAASSGAFGVDPGHWFKTMTKKINLMKEVEDRLSDDLEQQTSALRASARNTLLAIGLIVLAALAGVLLVVTVFTRKIVRPVLKGVEVAQAIANGDLTQEIDLSSASKDELGDLLRALDGMSSNLREMLQGIADYSGTLASSGEEMSAVSNQLVSNSEKMTAQSNTVAGTTEEMSTNINAMASAAEEMSVNIQTVSSTSEQMSQNMNTVATAVEEMSVTINDVAKNASEASKVADDASRKSMEATTTMQALGEAAGEIGQVTDAIKRIADQTNLLALNATIEAASAGEAGKGFAVVANEIKELANQSAQAAEDIAARIEGVQKNTGEAVTVISDVANIIATINESVTSIATAVEQQSSAANDIAANVGETNRGAQNIASSIAEVAKGANDMSKNAGEAAKGATDVSANIQGVSQASRDSNDGARQVNASAEDLAKIAGDLQTLVAQFRVNDSSGGRPAETQRRARPSQDGKTLSEGNGSSRDTTASSEVKELVSSPN